jgi:ferric-dicitrate binding protein FerR (iron transport regulator)
MSEHTPWTLIAKYLAGECSPEEKLTMEWWLEEPHNQALFQNIKASWQSAQPEDKNDFDAASGLARLHAKISSADGYELDTAVKNTRFVKFGSWLAAASVALLIGLGYWFTKKESLTVERISVADIIKTSGEKHVTHFDLPDGSRVWLNKNSKLAFPKAFEGNQRVVKLEGEAFFEVVPNPAKPFIVKSNKLSTQVLGTSFNVSAYKDDANASVSVATGKVEVSKEIKAGLPIRITQLTPQQKLVIDTEKDETYIDIVSTYDIGAWRKDQLVFANNTYAEVIGTLEASYNVKIFLKNKSLSNCRVMASFNEGTTLNDILKLLSISNSFHYTIEGNQVTVLGGVCR